MPKVAFIGAGSTVFMRHILGDMLMTPSLIEADIALMDIDAERLSQSRLVATRLVEQMGGGMKVSSTTDRRAALDGADFVVVSVQVGGYRPCTVTDFEIPKSYGLRQTIGDTLGIGGIMRGLRTVPFLWELCQDMSALCPDALMLQYVNPMAINCWAIAGRYPAIRNVGLCHSVPNTVFELCHDLDIPIDDVRYRVAGINHVAFFLSFERRQANGRAPQDARAGAPRGADAGASHSARAGGASDAGSKDGSQGGTQKGAADTGAANKNNGRDDARDADRDDAWSDLYPELRRRHRAGEIPKENPIMPGCPNHVRYEMMHQLGYFLTESSEHFSEYCPWFIKRGREDIIKEYEIPLDEYPRRCEAQVKEWNEQFEKLKRGERVELDKSREYAATIMDAMLTDKTAQIYGNVVNNGAIDDLPADCIVEVPCTVGARGVSASRIGAMPPQLVAMMRTNINVQELTVRALLEENREHIFHAAMFDPHTAAELDLKQIRAMTEELLKAHKEWLPKWTQ